MNTRSNDGNPSSTALPPRQKVFVDLDENLVSVLRAPKMRSELSASAEQCVDSGNQLKLRVSSLHDLNDAIDESEDPEILVRVVNLQEWASFFEKIVAVNKRYQQLVPDDEHLLIHVNILTSASYTLEGFMNNVFKVFFGEQLTLEIFGDKKNTFMNIYSQIMFQAEDNKGLFLEALYTRVWTRLPTENLPNLKFIPGLDKKNITLIDDKLRHCESARSFGFSAIHNSTSPSGREATMFYNNQKPYVFQKMQAIIDVAEQYCDELAASLGLNQERKSGANL